MIATGNHYHFHSLRGAPPLTQGRLRLVHIDSFFDKLKPFLFLQKGFFVCPEQNQSGQNLSCPSGQERFSCAGGVRRNSSTKNLKD